VDASKKEAYLSDTEFQLSDAFRHGHAAFAKMPGWKAKGVKTKLNLF
jgi:hypothetical protein